MEIAVTLTVVGLLVFLAHLFSALFDKTRVPDVLPLVFLGLLIGPILRLLSPESFGKVGGVFAVITLVIILFESGINFDLSTLGQSLIRGAYLTVAGFVVSLAGVGAVAAPMFGLSLLEGLMLGAILGGTSSAVVIPLVGQLSLQDRSRTILVLESTFSDVLCIVVTLALLEAVKFQELRFGMMVGQIVSSFLLAWLIGALAAVFWSGALRKLRRLENSTFTTPAFVFILFGVTEMFGWSGAIASLSFGILLGNIRSLPDPLLRTFAFLRPIKLNQTEISFFSEIVFLLKTFFFVYIGLSIRLNDVLLVTAGFVITVLVFLLRIPVVRLALDRGFPRPDAMLAAALVPKGLAAAVLASLPLQAGLTNGAVIQDVVYAVILFSIVLTAVLAFLIEKGMIRQPYTSIFAGYSEPPPAESAPAAAEPAPKSADAESSKT